MKRIISLILALMLCLSMPAMAAPAQGAPSLLTGTPVTYVFARAENPAQPILPDSPSFPGSGADHGRQGGYDGDPPVPIMPPK